MEVEDVFENDTCGRPGRGAFKDPFGLCGCDGGGDEEGCPESGEFREERDFGDGSEENRQVRVNWSVKTVKDSGHETGVVVHSKNRYSLTHLLENGHALRNGCRARAFPHITPAEEHALTQLETDIRKEIGNG